MSDPVLSVCLHCRAHIQLCNCGANHGQPHWSDGRTGRYCPGKAAQPHEPILGTSDTTTGGQSNAD